MNGNAAMSILLTVCASTLIAASAVTAASPLIVAVARLSYIPKPSAIAVPLPAVAFASVFACSPLAPAAADTVCLKGALVDAEYVVSPEYLAVIVWSPGSRLVISSVAFPSASF